MAVSDKRKAQMILYQKEHLKRVPLDLQPDFFAEVKAHAAAMGESVNGFVKRAIKETIARDDTVQAPPGDIDDAPAGRGEPRK